MPGRKQGCPTGKRAWIANSSVTRTHPPTEIASERGQSCPGVRMARLATFRRGSTDTPQPGPSDTEEPAMNTNTCTLLMLAMLSSLSIEAFAESGASGKFRIGDAEHVVVDGIAWIDGEDLKIAFTDRKFD